MFMSICTLYLIATSLRVFHALFVSLFLLRYLRYINVHTEELPNKGHFGADKIELFVICREIFLFGRFKMYILGIILEPKVMLFVERFVILSPY